MNKMEYYEQVIYPQKQKLKELHKEEDKKYYKFKTPLWKDKQDLN